MHVAILVKEFPPDVIGGTETQTMRMASEIQQRTENDVTVYTKAYPRSTDDDSAPYEIVRVPNWRLNPFVSTLTFVLAATLLLLRDADEFDVLQCMMIYPNGFVGYMVNRLSGLPYFAWIRGGDYYFMKDTPGKRWMIAKVLRDTVVLAQTERIATDVRDEFPDTNLEVLGNGVHIPGESANGDVLVFVGRLKEQKGVHVLIRALQDTEEKLLVIGDGPERDRLETLADKLDVDAEFAGEVDPTEVNQYLRKGKAFVLPSIRGEGLPNAVLEAMALGLPVIVTDTGGVADAVIHGETGYVVEPGDQDSLRDRIGELCGDDEKRKRMGARAQDWVVENHGWQRIVNKLETIYNEVTTDQ